MSEVLKAPIDMETDWINALFLLFLAPFFALTGK